jgi:hypothetical protein
MPRISDALLRTRIPTALVLGAEPELLDRCQVAAVEVGVVVKGGPTSMAEALAEERRPLVIVTPEPVYTIEPERYEAMARVVLGTVLHVQPDISEQELEERMLRAVRASAKLREWRAMPGRYTVVGEDTSAGEPGQVPSSARRISPMPGSMRQSTVAPPSSRSAPSSAQRNSPASASARQSTPAPPLSRQASPIPGSERGVRPQAPPTGLQAEGPASERSPRMQAPLARVRAEGPASERSLHMQAPLARVQVEGPASERSGRVRVEQLSSERSPEARRAPQVGREETALPSLRGAPEPAAQTEVPPPEEPAPSSRRASPVFHIELGRLFDERGLPRADT